MRCIYLHILYVLSLGSDGISSSAAGGTGGIWSFCSWHWTHQLFNSDSKSWSFLQILFVRCTSGQWYGHVFTTGIYLFNWSSTTANGLWSAVHWCHLWSVPREAGTTPGTANHGRPVKDCSWTLRCAFPFPSNNFRLLDWRHSKCFDVIRAYLFVIKWVEKDRRYPTPRCFFLMYTIFRFLVFLKSFWCREKRFPYFSRSLLIFRHFVMRRVAFPHNQCSLVKKLNKSSVYQLLSFENMPFVFVLLLWFYFHENLCMALSQTLGNLKTCPRTHRSDTHRFRFSLYFLLASLDLRSFGVLLWNYAHSGGGL